jgi:FixJ family two-component response regulator
MSAPGPAVFLVDDDPSFLQAVTRVLRASGLRVSSFPSAAAFLEAHDPSEPGCLVLDLAMPGCNGLELQEALAARGSDRPIIFLTGRADVPSSVRAMKGGAVDFLTKPVADTVLLAAIEAAFRKDAERRREREQHAELERRLAALTPREREVLRHVVAGQLNKQIAADLGTVERTIKLHRSHLMAKLEVRSVAELVRLVERAGLPPLA